MLVLLGSCHNVYISVTKSSQDFLYQDGGHLANIQPHDSILWGKEDFVLVHVGLNMKKKNYFWQVILHTYIDSLRDDENREVNKHGKPQKVNFFFYIPCKNACFRSEM